MTPLREAAVRIAVGQVAAVGIAVAAGTAVTAECRAVSRIVTAIAAAFDRSRRGKAATAELCAAVETAEARVRRHG